MMILIPISFKRSNGYETVRRSGALSIGVFAKLYRVNPETVRFFECANARAFKFSIPRPRVQGDPGDADMHGGQQFIPLMSIEIPEK